MLATCYDSAMSAVVLSIMMSDNARTHVVAALGQCDTGCMFWLLKEWARINYPPKF